MSETHGIAEIRRKFHGLARAADRGSRAAAIKLQCVQCMGGSLREARACATSDCPLYAYRPGQTTGHAKVHTVAAPAAEETDR